MDCKELATKARQSFEGWDSMFGGRGYLALIGILDGVASGKIQTGQKILGEILLGLHLNNSERADIMPRQLKEPNFQIISELFASGMCSEGQPLRGRASGQRER